MIPMNAVRTFLISALWIPGLLYAQVSVVSELSHDKEIVAGTPYDGSILVRNDTGEPQEIKVYQTDYDFSFDGTNRYGEPGTSKRSNARWISFRPTNAVIPPMATLTINYTVTVPHITPERQLEGTYWSMLMVEGVPKGSKESTIQGQEQKAQMGLTQILRYGIQIATHIAQTGTKAVKFLQAVLVKKEDGGRDLQVDIENTGTLGIRPDVYVEVFDGAGKSLGKFSGARYRIYPGTSVREIIDLSRIPAGSYRALVVLDAGGDEAYAAQYTLEF
jgi:hypothetical protein